MKATYVNRVSIPAIIAALIAYVAIGLKPVLYLHVQQTPFLRTCDFFSKFILNPGGITQYLSQLFMQGFHSNVSGTILLLLLIIVQVLLTRHLLKSLFKIKGWLGPFIMLVLTLAILENYNFPFVVLFEQIFVLLALIGLSKTDLKKGSFFIAYFLLFFILYYVVGAGSALVFMAGSTIVFLHRYSWKDSYKIGLLILASLVLQFIGYTYLFNMSLFDAYLGFFPDPIVDIKYQTNLWTYGYFFLIPIILILSYSAISISRIIPEKIIYKLSSFYVALILTALFTASSAIFLSRNMNESARNEVLCDYYNYTGNYDQTIELALSTSNEYNALLNLYYNSALLKRGEFIERFLEYPQLLGSRILAPNQLGSPLYRMISSDLYYELGYISQAQHDAYAVLAIESDNLRAKKRLVQTNILMGNPRAAGVYLSSISKGFHSKEFVDSYSQYITNPELVKKDPSLAAKLENMPENFAIPGQMDFRLRDLIQKNDSNKLAYDYLQAFNLLDHQLGYFMNDLEASMKFYDAIPLVYEEAIIMYFFSTESEGMDAYPISQKAKTEFNKFLSTMSANSNNKELAKGELTALQDTYMYYVTYYSPKVTKAKTVNKAY